MSGEGGLVQDLQTVACEEQHVLRVQVKGGAWCVDKGDFLSQ